MSRPKLKKVLVIDDEEANAFISRTFLQRADCAEVITSFQEAKEGLSVLQNTPVPEVILVDINMPGMNAWQFVREARVLLPDGPFPFIVLLTSSINAQDKKAAEEHPDIQMFVSKPLNPEKVDEILDKYFLEVHDR